MIFLTCVYTYVTTTPINMYHTVCFNLFFSHNLIALSPPSLGLCQGQEHLLSVPVLCRITCDGVVVCVCVAMSPHV